MSFLGVILIYWYFTSGRNNPKFYWHKKLIFFFIIACILSSFIPNLLVASIILLILAAPFIIIHKIITSIIKSFKRTSTGNAGTYNTTMTAGKRTHNNVNKSALPSAVPKRIKLLKKFNDKYNLTLKESQINTIVNASYVTHGWERFLESMTHDYSSIHEWFHSSYDNWLRVYIYVFNVQTISSDMEQQKRICLDSFYQIFSSINLAEYNTPAWDIEKINNEFLTNFDDVTFMIAYRFLERNGKTFELGRPEVISAKDDIDNLKAKYGK